MPAYRAALAQVWGDAAKVRRVQMPLLIKAGRMD
jgi:hypothetical protein